MTGNDYASIMFLAFAALVGAALVMILGHNPAQERVLPGSGVPHPGE
jgi:hypothetical protein